MIVVARQVVHHGRRTPPLKAKPAEGLWATGVAQRLGIGRSSLTKLKSRSRVAPHTPPFPPADGIDPKGRRGPQEWWLPSTVDAYKATRPGRTGRPRATEPGG